MIFGQAVSVQFMFFTGLVIFLVLLFQVLQGLRKIKFKGRLHQRVHRWTAFTMLGLAAAHAFLGFVFVFQLNI